MMRILIYILIILTSSSCSLIFEKSIEGESVTILAPKDSLVSDVYVQKFYWEKVDHAIQYRFQIAEPSFGSITSIVLDTVIKSTELSYSLNPGDYQWRIRAENSGSETDYITRNIFINPADFTTTTVTQESPSNNAISYVSLSRFSWESLYDAVEYELEIDTITGNFTSPIFRTSTAALFYNHSFTKRGKYMWRVRAKNAVGDYSAYSDMRTYTFDLEAPTLVGPLDKASVRLPLNLSWSSVTDAVTYELFLTDTLLVNPDPSVYPKTGIAQNSFQINTLTVNKDYFWQVKAVDANGYKSTLSVRRRFSLIP